MKRPCLLFTALLLALPLCAENGPRMPEAALYDALDLSLPDLAPVRQALDAGDMGAAREALAAYFRNRDNVTWYFDGKNPDPGAIPRQHELDDLSVYNRAMADAAVENRFSIVGLEHHFTDGIQWDLNPTEAEGSPIPYNPEWTWVFNRQRYWVALGRAWWETQDPKYAETFVAQLTDWIRSNPVLEDTRRAKAHGSRWRSIEAGIRMSETWPWAWHFFLTAPQFDAEAISLFLRSVCEHARYLRDYHTDYNWLTLEMKGLYFVGGLFPEFREAAGWREFAAGKMREELEVQFYPDGMQTELSPSIHNRVLGTFSDIVDVARMNGYPLPDGYVAKLEPAYALNMVLMTPQRGVPLFQDCWQLDGPHMLARGLRYFPERDDFHWFASHGEEGVKPDWTSNHLPWAGYYVMRSGWDRDALYLAFDAGPYGGKHQHEDKLNFVLTAYGRDLVVEAGSYAFDESKWRQFTLNSYGHNVIIVDGMPQERRFYLPHWNAESPLPCTWLLEDDYEYAEATYGGEFEKYKIAKEEIARHTRRILFVKAAKTPFFIIADTVRSMDGAPHTCESLFHLAAPEAEIRGDGTVVTEYEEGPQLAIVPLVDDELTVDIVQGQVEPHVLGWLPEHPHGVPGVREAPVARFTRTGDGTLYFVYAFVPTRAGEAPEVALSAGIEDPLHVEIRGEGGLGDWSIRFSESGPEVRALPGG